MFIKSKAAYPEKIPERRKFKRHPKALVVSCKDLKGRNFNLKVKNMSLGGIGFSSQIQITKGTVLRMSIQLEEYLPPFVITGKVVWSEWMMNEYRGGIEFLEVTREVKNLISHFCPSI